MRIKCVLGDEIRVVTPKRDISEDGLLRMLEHEYGRAIIGLHYILTSHNIDTQI